jgi:hypothetical protein
VLKWTKQHLDAYLTTAEIHLQQNILDPGWVLVSLHYNLCGGYGWEEVDDRTIV